MFQSESNFIFTSEIFKVDLVIWLFGNLKIMKNQ